MPENLQCEIHSFLLNIIYIYSIANVDPFNTEMFLPIKFDLVKMSQVRWNLMCSGKLSGA